MITGSSAKVRERLEKSGKSLGALGFPAKVFGDVDSPSGDIELSRNENGRDLNNDGTDDDVLRRQHKLDRG